MDSTAPRMPSRASASPTPIIVRQSHGSNAPSLASAGTTTTGASRGSGSGHRSSSVTLASRRPQPPSSDPTQLHQQLIDAREHAANLEDVNRSLLMQILHLRTLQPSSSSSPRRSPHPSAVSPSRSMRSHLSNMFPSSAALGVQHNLPPTPMSTTAPTPSHTQVAPSTSASTSTSPHRMREVIDASEPMVPARDLHELQRRFEQLSTSHRVLEDFRKRMELYVDSTEIASQQQELKSLRDKVRSLENQIAQLVDEKQEIMTSKQELEKQWAERWDADESNVSDIDLVRGDADITINLQAANIQRLEDELEESQERLSELESLLSQEKSEKMCLEIEVKVLMSKVGSLKTELESATFLQSQSHRKVSAEQSRWEIERQELQEKNAALEKELSKARKLSNQDTRSIENQLAQLNSLQQARVELSNAVRDKQRIEDELASTTSKLRNEMEEKLGFKAQLLEAEAKFQAREAVYAQEIEQLEAHVQMETKKRKALESKQAVSNHGNTEAVDELKSALEKSVSEATRMIMEQESLEKLLAEEKSLSKRLRDELEKEKGKSQTLSEQQNSQLAPLKVRLSQLEQEAIDLENEKASLIRQLSQQKASQTSLTESINRSNITIQKLEVDNKRLQATIDEVNKTHSAERLELSAKVKKLEMDVQGTTSKLKETQASLQSEKQYAAELQEKLVQQKALVDSYQIQQSSSETKQVEKEKLESEKRQLIQQIELLKSQLYAAQSALNEAESQVREYESRVSLHNSLLDEVVSLKSKLTSTEQDLRKSSQLLQQQEEKESSQKDEGEIKARNLREKLLGVETERTFLEQRVQSLEKEKEDFLDKHARLGEEFAQILTQLRSKNDPQDPHNIRFSELEANEVKMAERIQSLERTVEQYEQEITKLESSLNNQTQALSQSLVLEKKLKSDVSSLEQSIHEKESKILALQTLIEEKQQIAESLQQKVMELQKTKSAPEAIQVEADGKISLQKRISELEQELDTTYAKLLCSRAVEVELRERLDDLVQEFNVKQEELLDLMTSVQQKPEEQATSTISSNKDSTLSATNNLLEDNISMSSPAGADPEFISKPKPFLKVQVNSPQKRSSIETRPQDAQQQVCESAFYHEKVPTPRLPSDFGSESGAGVDSDSQTSDGDSQNQISNKSDGGTADRDAESDTNTQNHMVQEDSGSGYTPHAASNSVDWMSPGTFSRKYPISAVSPHAGQALNLLKTNKNEQLATSRIPRPLPAIMSPKSLASGTSSTNETESQHTQSSVTHEIAASPSRIPRSNTLQNSNLPGISTKLPQRLGVGEQTPDSSRASIVSTSSLNDQGSQNSTMGATPKSGMSSLKEVDKQSPHARGSLSGAHSLQKQPSITSAHSGSMHQSSAADDSDGSENSDNFPVIVSPVSKTSTLSQRSSTPGSRSLAQGTDLLVVKSPQQFATQSDGDSDVIGSEHDDDNENLDESESEGNRSSSSFGDAKLSTQRNIQNDGNKASVVMQTAAPQKSTPNPIPIQPTGSMYAGLDDEDDDEDEDEESDENENVQDDDSDGSHHVEDDDENDEDEDEDENKDDDEDSEISLSQKPKVTGKDARDENPATTWETLEIQDSSKPSGDLQRSSQLPAADEAVHLSDEEDQDDEPLSNPLYISRSNPTTFRKTTLPDEDEDEFEIQTDPQIAATKSLLMKPLSEARKADLKGSGHSVFGDKAAPTSATKTDPEDVDYKYSHPNVPDHFFKANRTDTKSKPLSAKTLEKMAIPAKESNYGSEDIQFDIEESFSKQKALSSAKDSLDIASGMDLEESPRQKADTNVGLDFSNEPEENNSVDGNDKDFQFAQYDDDLDIEEEPDNGSGRGLSHGDEHSEEYEQNDDDYEEEEEEEEGFEVNDEISVDDNAEDHHAGGYVSGAHSNLTSGLFRQSAPRMGMNPPTHAIFQSTTKYDEEYNVDDEEEYGGSHDEEGPTQHSSISTTGNSMTQPAQGIMKMANVQNPKSMYPEESEESEGEDDEHDEHDEDEDEDEEVMINPRAYEARLSISTKDSQLHSSMQHTQSAEASYDSDTDSAQISPAQRRLDFEEQSANAEEDTASDTPYSPEQGYVLRPRNAPQKQNIAAFAYDDADEDEDDEDEDEDEDDVSLEDEDLSLVEEWD
eukprot:TRINITY_DN5408_c0_g3_i1.p1 TRINITY_DN5408_c0_g3~~TRINITY_DN5408_c0_g3_i1.p1  ORF type:complete len:2126 (-),score=546.48 TRINITY_DN5408_c0_g3_i1:203-6580(-)